MTATDAQQTKSARQLGIDVARGLAVLLMIQTHAYDGWVSAVHKASFAYSVSRAIANIPAPLFLLLAGVGLELGGQAALRREKHPEVVRKKMMRRALEVVFYGYLVSAIYCLIEWRLSIPSLLRADILHCIGLSLLVCSGVMLLRGRLVLRALIASAAALGLALWAGHSGLTSRLPGWSAPIAGLLFDVPNYTRFPLLPLIGFCAIGMAVAPRLVKPQSPRRWLLFAAIAVALALFFGVLTRATLAALGGKLSRSHPAVIWNFCDGSCRALATVCVGMFLGSVQRAEAIAIAWLVRLGRGSLLAYAVHIPLCYGRLAMPVANKLSMAQATPLVIALMGFTLIVVYVRDRVRESRATSGSRPATA